MAVTSYLEQYANNQDLQQFFQLENPMAYGSNYTFVSINGKNNLYSHNNRLADHLLRRYKQPDLCSFWRGS